MARVYGGSGTLTLPSTQGPPAAVGYAQCSFSFVRETEDNREFGDAFSHFQHLIVTGAAVRGSFVAKFDTTFDHGDMIDAVGAVGRTSDGTFSIRTESAKGLSFPAILSDVTVEMDRTAFHVMRGTFESSGVLTEITA